MEEGGEGREEVAVFAIEEFHKTIQKQFYIELKGINHAM